jgi:LAS superfamily LD-carboxypeptidase LdcB
MGRRKKRRKIKRFLFLILFLFIVLFVAYEYYSDNRYDPSDIESSLKALDYSDESINLIIDEDIQAQILNESVYSKTLEMALIENKFYKKHLDIYLFIEYIDEDTFIDNLNKLGDLGYKKGEIKTLINNLSSEDILEVAGMSSKEKELLNYCIFDNFILKNYDRYVEYKKNNISVDYEQVMALVNTNLDYAFYEDVEDALNQNTDLVLVNKHYKLGSNYVPEYLETLDPACASRNNIYVNSTTKVAFEELCNDAKELGFTIKVSSGYRSYDVQKNIYNSYLKSDSIEEVDTYSARAGHSEHQTGYTVDVYNGIIPYNRFGSTNDYLWAKENIYKYGFIIRYQKDKEYITGYKSEEWHLRYVGIEAATYIYENNITLEEYLLNNKLPIEKV